ncbi:tetratricopeptide repeat protein 36 isoform X2 [Rhineura floridana]|uniref:tetratricopeptide repeat protein 36 isoform X2 n=1 Tax=Rhineura floridana TaxID=261503 RepID=UPI002AC88504|nr:tetratricopeptide repeat protein 36 isoform X2 [Rhineura floridana]
MATANDRAVLQSIFHPNTPFGEISAELEEVQEEGARKDLDMTLKLSKGVGRVACQGFVQRGLIQRLQGQEEAARKDFEQAASLGSTFARQQLVLMNPYAALCNQMLSEVVKKLHCPREEPQQEASSREKECH